MNNNLQNNTLKDNTTSKSDTQPSLCVSCFQFYGNPNQDNQCSQCFKKNKTKITEVAANPTNQQATSSDTSAQVKPLEEKKENELPKQEDTSKCWECKKKVGMLGIACRCGYTYCKNHRLPEDHNCAFDYTTKEREQLKQKNPIVAASKLEKL